MDENLRRIADQRGLTCQEKRMEVLNMASYHWPPGPGKAASEGVLFTEQCPFKIHMLKP